MRRSIATLASLVTGSRPVEIMRAAAAVFLTVSPLAALRAHSLEHLEHQLRMREGVARVRVTSAPRFPDAPRYRTGR